MRIYHVIGSMDPSGGGPPAVAARLAAAQAGLGHEVRILCYGSPDDRYEVRKSLSDVPNIDRVAIVALSPAPGWPRWREQFTGKMIKQYLHERLAPGDILHLHGVWESLLLRSSRVARKLHVPYVVAPHGMLDPWSLRQSRIKKRVALRLGFGQMLDSAAFLHTLNNDERDLLAPLQLKPRTEVIPNGVFLQEIDPLPAPGSFYRSQPQLMGRPYVLFLSRLHHKKGLDQLARAFGILAPKLPQLQWVVAGPDGGEKDNLTQWVSQKSLGDRVHMVGPLYGKAKWEALVDAACFCLPSRQEGFSMAITEAMAAGKAVVISPQCHFPQVAEAGAGFIVDLNPAAMAGALQKLVQDQTLAQDYGRAGRSLVRERYTWDRVAVQTIDAYKQVGALDEPGSETGG